MNEIAKLRVVLVPWVIVMLIGGCVYYLGDSDPSNAEQSAQAEQERRLIESSLR